MDPTLQNTDLNQVGPSTDPNQPAQTMQQAPQLSPQQRAQMMQYAQGLMNPATNGPPVNTMGSGMSELARSLIGGYVQNQTSPQQSTPQNNLFNGLFGTGQQQPAAPMNITPQS